MCEFNAVTQVECMRCLKDFQHTLHSEFSEMYAFKNRSMDESDLLLSEDANIELEPIVREYLLLEVPISAICRPDCKGLCLECGEDLNLATCEHAVRSMN